MMILERIIMPFKRWGFSRSLLKSNLLITTKHGSLLMPDKNSIISGNWPSI